MMTPRALLSHKLRDGAYRARRFGCPVDPDCTLQAAVGLLDQDDCYYCGGPLFAYELDHKQPLERGGAHELANICKSCPRCNHTKNAKTEREFMQWHRN